MMHMSVNNQQRRLRPEFEGDGVKFFCCPTNYEIWRGRQGTYCLLELNVGLVWLLYMVTGIYLILCPIHTADADATRHNCRVESRRRCVLGFSKLHG